MPLADEPTPDNEPTYTADTVARLVQEARAAERVRVASLVKGVFAARIALCETRRSEYQEQVARHAEAGRYEAARFDAVDRDKHSDRGAYLDTFLSDILREIKALPAEPAP